MRLSKSLLSLLGTRCQVCEQWQGDALCADCHHAFRRVSHRCHCCAKRLEGLHEVCGRCVRCPPAFDRTFAALDYAYPWDGLITRFKFSGACELAGPLAEPMVEGLQQAQVAGLAMPAVLLPVPLAAERLRERGYNQAWELARRVGPALGVSIQARWVERVIATPHQIGLGREERMHNLQGAFAVTPAGRAGLAGRSVAILDDVMTTGSTAQALAATLRRAGAVAVQVWVLARTVDER
jgi:ComF family protein